jgi:alpha-galactosidase
MPTYFTVPYAIANQPMAILPEQTGVWCMPVRKFRETETTDEQVVINMVNSFYYVIHLATRLEHLSETQKELLKEGLAYYRSLAEAKKTALPIMPRGFASVEDEVVCLGMKTDEKLYLSWYHMTDGEDEIVEDLRKYGAKSVKLAYPLNANNEYSIENGIFRCKMQGESARAFEFEIEK